MKSTLVFLGLFILSVKSSIFEFTINPGKELCVGDYFTQDTHVNYKFNAVFSIVPDKKPKGKKKKRVRISSFVEADDGTVYSSSKQHGKLTPLKIKKSHYIHFCFLNKEKAQVMVRLDLYKEAYAGDTKTLLRASDSHNLMERLTGVENRLNNTVHLYKGMEKFERKQVSTSSSVMGYLVIFSQISLFIIISSGCVMVLSLKKMINDKKKI